MYFKIIFLIQFFIKITVNDIPNILANQHFLFESRIKNIIENKNLYVNIIKIEINKINENNQQNTLEILAEIDTKIGEDIILVISPYLYHCFLFEFINQYSVKDANIGENGEKLINLMEITPLLYAEVNLEIKRNVQELMNIHEWLREIKNINGIDSMFHERNNIQNKLTKLICFLNPKGNNKLIKNKEFIKKKKN
ncbi:hypothetical protein Mgra_00005951 [Meloidogyne graminicola]|uniref:Uncharacterized protein n=1 Tax=Meloidogyne graminicola TaxID=189291 RepID=A0A8S9ZMG7_9BILA|nr:hypothetical protein Mgra_00005951 [Meloidogyne graminicola]